MYNRAARIPTSPVLYEDIFSSEPGTITCNTIGTEGSPPNRITAAVPKMLESHHCLLP